MQLPHSARQNRGEEQLSTATNGVVAHSELTNKSLDAEVTDINTNRK